MTFRAALLTFIVFISSISFGNEFQSLSECPHTRFPYWDFNLLHGPHRIYAGPEIFYLKRVREGGSKQSGPMYGFRIGYDHIRRNAFYWSIDYYIARGFPKGKTGNDSHLKSKMTESQIEGLFGFTLRRHLFFCTNFTPYVGIGRFIEQNNFTSPSPLHVHFRNTLNYAAVGMLMQASCAPCLTVGLNVKAKFVFDAKSRVTHDPLNEDLTLIIGDRTQWEVELPVNYSHFECRRNLGVLFVPFFRYRHYGGRENFPFDFLDTRYYSLGARLELTYVF